MNAKQAFALGLAAASPEFRAELIAKVFPEAFDHGPPRMLFQAMAADDAKAIRDSLAEMGIDLKPGEKVKPYLLRTLSDDGRREKVDSLLHRARLAKTFGGTDAVVDVLRIGLTDWDAKQVVPNAT